MTGSPRDRVKIEVAGGGFRFDLSNFGAQTSALGPAGSSASDFDKITVDFAEIFDDMSREFGRAKRQLTSG